eukprot:TRINITY_DN61184_c0_g2_i1.p1 TRINITY_DN61184_c0_g2~~TRINITY_DN61184_c0_g2_i1.p1  ORF type:complete len:707 (-),score=65.04 TRINITY_DN61184_c0_g2_i1:57-2177(-)
MLPTVPPTVITVNGAQPRPHRNHYILFDGTKNTDKHKNKDESSLRDLYDKGKYPGQTNIAAFKDLLHIRDQSTLLSSKEQKTDFGVYYQECHISHKSDSHSWEDHILYFEGVGTQQNPIAALVDSVLGRSAKKLVQFAFEKMCELTTESNYFVSNVDQPGDNLIIMGFSRGAVQARLLCHVLDATGGFLPGRKDCTAIFEPLSKNSHGKAAGKLRDVCIHMACNKEEPLPVKVTFLGLYDSVIGASSPTKDPTGGALNRVGNSLNAISKGLPPSTAKGFMVDKVPSCCNFVAHAVSTFEYRRDYRSVLIRPTNETRTRATEVWFPGWHSDIGGGNEANVMCKYTLAWMLDQLDNTLTTQGNPRPCGTNRQPCGIKPTMFLTCTTDLTTGTLEENYKPTSHPTVNSLEAPSKLKFAQIIKRAREIPDYITVAPLVFSKEWKELSEKHLSEKTVDIARFPFPQPFYTMGHSCESWKDAADALCRGGRAAGGSCTQQADHQDVAEMKKKLQQQQELASKLADIRQEIEDVQTRACHLEEVLENSEQTEFDELCEMLATAMQKEENDKEVTAKQIKEDLYEELDAECKEIQTELESLQNDEQTKQEELESKVAEIERWWENISSKLSTVDRSNGRAPPTIPQQHTCTPGALQWQYPQQYPQPYQPYTHHQVQPHPHTTIPAMHIQPSAPFWGFNQQWPMWGPPSWWQTGM